MKIRIASILVVLLALQGCATMNEQECVTGDWYAIGYEDGVQGRTGDRIAKYRKACADHNVTPDFRAYQDGREEGLREFCQPQIGFRVGQRGGSYSGICPTDLEPGFVSAFQEGKHLYGLRAQVNTTTNQIAYKKNELHELEEELVHVGAALLDGDATFEEKAILLVNAKDMARRQGELKHEILDLERDKAIYQDRLASYLHTIAYNY